MVVQPAVGHIRLQGIQGVAGIQVSSYVNVSTERNCAVKYNTYSATETIGTKSTVPTVPM